MNNMQPQPQILKEEPGLRMELSCAQREARLQFRQFVGEHITPHAGRWDREERIPLELIGRLRENGYLGAPLPVEAGGGGLDAITYGLLTEELARGCSSVRSLLTVHDMVALAIWRWGSRELKTKVGTAAARAELLCALALTEPDVGSDAAGVQTEARAEGDGYVLNGRKKWITYGQIADLFIHGNSMGISDKQYFSIFSRRKKTIHHQVGLGPIAAVSFFKPGNQDQK